MKMKYEILPTAADATGVDLQRAANLHGMRVLRIFYNRNGDRFMSVLRPA